VDDVDVFYFEPAIEPRSKLVELRFVPAALGSDHEPIAQLFLGQSEAEPSRCADEK
jgi:hypothetical protein